jgi:tetratricopeptide (TPR) repeat protein
MINHIKIILIIACFLLLKKSYAQIGGIDFASGTGKQSVIDSLITKLQLQKEDTNKVNTLNDIGMALSTMNFEESKNYIIKSRNLSTKLNYKKGIANALSSLALVYELQGDYLQSLNFQNQALKLREEIGDQSGISYSVHYIGDIYFSQSDLSDKLSTKDDFNIKALEQYFKSLKIAEAINDKKSIANSYNCIGNSYREKMEYAKSLAYYEKAITLKENFGDKMGMAQTFGNIGKLYLKQNNYEKALEYLFKSLQLAQETGYKRTHVKALGTIGNIYLKQKDYIKALDYCNKSLALSKEIGFLEYTAKANHSLSEIYGAIDFIEHNGDKALTYYKSYIVERDSINTKNALQAELQFDFEKREQIRVLEEKQLEIKRLAESKQQKIILYAVSSGLLLMFVLAIVIFRGYQQKQKSNKELLSKNEIIAMQKHLVEEKHKEITDSIHYAQRIQRALITPEKYIEKQLNKLNKKV